MMNAILIRDDLKYEEMNQLLQEFPQYNILTVKGDQEILDLGHEALSKIEIIYGCILTPKELNLVPQLHWIHCCLPYTDGLCIDSIKTKENILITTTKAENIAQVGEFAIAAALAFSKELFEWERYSRDPNHLNIKTLRNKMWKLQDKVFLQIGLGVIGTEIARRAKQEGFKVWGVQELATYHPYSQKTYSLDQLPEILPQADIVSLSMPREQRGSVIFDKEKFSLIKDDCIFLVFGSSSVINLDDLEEAGKTEKFRGILLDCHFPEPLSRDSPLWKMPRVIIAQESGSYPITFSHRAFKVFIYNLRQYLYGNFNDMKNLLK